ncbi:hypothetical protein CQW23_28256 [Capsicum baccatum]|uniref:Uncharacterized protein n=1 Tax=Capsicum baccatum TaxID=33114 RepID=A0A2G2VG47_CAPBA|nr:hypothetical protein CQW23_28256 [Capsicum baccatum]
MVISVISMLGGNLSLASSVPEVQLSHYIPTLEKLATLRLLQQAHRTIQISDLSKKILFFDFAVIEKISMNAIRHNFVAIKVNQIKGDVFFGTQDAWRMDYDDI